MILSFIVAGIALLGVVIFALSINSRPRRHYSDYSGAADLGLDRIPDRPPLDPDSTRAAHRGETTGRNSAGT